MTLCVCAVCVFLFVLFFLKNKNKKQKNKKNTHTENYDGVDRHHFDANCSLYSLADMYWPAFKQSIIEGGAKVIHIHTHIYFFFILGFFLNVKTTKIKKIKK